MIFKNAKLMVILTLVIVTSIAYIAFLHFTPPKPKYITNPERSDGFGAQFQTIIYSAIYAEMNNMTFLYTPFRTMEHNYDNNEQFLDNKETLINFINHHESITNHSNVIRLSVKHFIKYFENNIQACSNTKTLKTIKKLFRDNKPKNYFNNDKINIAMHIRRPNSHDTRLAGADVPDQVFLQILDYLKNKYKNEAYLVHIYSQGTSEQFHDFVSSNVILHINESIEDTFTGMALADILVISPSSLSYTAGIISNGQVYYLPFWHPPLPSWKIINFSNQGISIN